MAQHLTNIGSVQPKGGSDISGKKYILDLQVNKYGLSAALWQEETGRQLKSSKCLVYQGADIAF